jgi:hypothetical protein
MVLRLLRVQGSESEKRTRLLDEAAESGKREREARRRGERYAVETKKIIARELTVAPRCLVTRYQCDGVG